MIVNYNTAHLLRPMFEACEQAAKGLQVRYWVVDNASQDDSVALLRSEFMRVGLEVNSQNVGFGRANNQLLRHLQGDYVLLLNTDAFVSPDTLQRTLAYIQANPACGVLGVKLVGRDGDLQPSCRYFPTPWNVFLSRTGLGRLFPGTRMVDDMAWNHASVRECDWVPGCYYLVRRAVLDQVGLFDPRFFLYYEEVDHCRRVKAAGWQVVYFPDTTVVHVGGESAKSVGKLSNSGRQLSALQVESELLYFRKHGGWASLIQHVCLTTIGAAYLMLKDVLKRRGWVAVRQRGEQLALTLRLCVHTRWATKPTR
ncbi:glycosyltransferase family 2 protein [Hydrogenophaga defluvii]|uniref:glycosyltransferase family 2 protein n=1 Tax=Hydrogenophaga defluvii TaxID=249410 RepID=UPI0036D3D617